MDLSADDAAPSSAVPAALAVYVVRVEWLAALARHPALRRARPPKALFQEVVRLKAGRDRLSLAGLGATVSCRARTLVPGALWVPLPVAVQLRRVARGMRLPTLQLALEEGVARLERHSVRHPGITARRPAAPPRAVRLAPAPDVLELLRFAAHVGPEKVALAQMSARVARARADADRLLEQAAHLLQPLGIGRDVLARLFERMTGKRR